VKKLAMVVVLAVGCGSGGGAGGDAFVAATIDGVAWRVVGEGAELTTATGEPSLTILGYTPLAGSKQADDSKPMLDIVFTGVVPAAGAYDVATTSYLTVMYMPDRQLIYGADTGTVTITTITPSMVEGTFAFTGSALGVSQALTVIDGSFHVPITRP
jgi:hypothetical protein